MAELNGTDAGTLKERLGLDSSLPDGTPWGEAYGMVKLGRIAELNGTTVDALKSAFDMRGEVGADTPWSEVERDVERAMERSAGSGGGHGE